MSSIKFRGDKEGSRKSFYFPMEKWMKLKEGDYIWNKNKTEKRMCLKGTGNGIVYLERKNIKTGYRGDVIHFPYSRDEFRPYEDD